MSLLEYVLSSYIQSHRKHHKEKEYIIKKQWLGLGVALLPLYAAQVWAAPNPATGLGCGLGKLAWGEYGNRKDIAPQVLQSTTNGTFGSQTFAIASALQAAPITA